MSILTVPPLAFVKLLMMLLEEPLAGCLHYLVKHPIQELIFGSNDGSSVSITATFMSPKQGMN